MSSYTHIESTDKEYETRYLCIKELKAEDGVHFIVDNYYKGEYSIADSSLKVIGEKDKPIYFYNGNHYFKNIKVEIKR